MTFSQSPVKLKLLVRGLLVVTFANSSIEAQTAYSPANGPSSIRPWKDGYFTADFTEAEFGLAFIRDLELGCASATCTPNHVNFSLHVTGAARKGQRNLLSKVDFIPGFDLGGAVAFLLSGSNGGYDMLYIRGIVSGQERKVVMSDTAGGTTTIGEDRQTTYAAAVGFNHAFSQMSILGISLEGRRELSSPGIRQPSEICGPGLAANGVAVLICNDRYVGPLPDLWTGQARVDALLDIAALTNNPSGLHLGLAGAGVIDFAEGVQEQTNVGFGPTINAPEYPGQPVISAMLGIHHVFQANEGSMGGADLTFPGRQVFVRLAFSIPFRVLAGTT